MTAAAKFVSLHDKRVSLVQRTLKQHTKLGDKATLELAEHVLEALDYMPENVR